ncbi:MAG TPA: dihydroorotate dehydrogenase [Phycisphaerales bacterium]|nr:dihydroorotate dehydrogenase [Phycisphaerales bacterium]
MASAFDNLSVTVAGIPMQTCLIAAAGTAGYVEELPSVSDVRALGAIVTKSITVAPRIGNDPWRIIDVPGRSGMLNAIGLANVGLETFISGKLPKAATVRTNIIGSVAGESIEDYVRIAAAFDAQPALCAMELNVSCPNTADGLLFGESPTKLSELLRETRKVVKRAKLFVKLSPNVSDITAMANVAVKAGVDAITLINTVSAMAIDVETREPRLTRGSGGLSGPAIHPIAVRMVHEVYRKVAKAANVPIIGLGGVMNWRDAAELVLAGASAIGMGTVLFVDPGAPMAIARGLSAWVKAQGGTSIMELVGQAKTA